MIRVLVACSLLLGALALWGILLYNRLTRMRTAVQASWQQVDVELQRRYDLIPSLVATVKGAAGFESTVLENITGARTAALAAKSQPPATRQVPEQTLTTALTTLLALAESNPVLGTTVNFRDLQEELSNTEDRIAASRSFYNQNVEDYNSLRLTFPLRLIAAPLGFRPAAYFEVASLDVRAPADTGFGLEGSPETPPP